MVNERNNFSYLTGSLVVLLRQSPLHPPLPWTPALARWGLGLDPAGYTERARTTKPGVAAAAPVLLRGGTPPNPDIA